MPDISYVWNKTNVDILVSDATTDTLDDIKIRKIADFFKILKVKNISEGIVAKLVNNGYDDVISIITADIKKLALIDGLGEKIITKIRTGFEKNIKNVNLYTLMAASNIFGRGFGVRRLKIIVTEYPNIMQKDWDNDKMKSKIKDLVGFDDVTATQFTEHFADFKTFYNILAKNIDLSHITTNLNIKKKNIGDLMKDELIVFTGIRDKTVEEFIENNGGKISTTLSGKTTMLIYLDEKTSGSKLEKAKKMNIKTMPIVDFKNKYKI